MESGHLVWIRKSQTKKDPNSNILWFPGEIQSVNTSPDGKSSMIQVVVGSEKHSFKIAKNEEETENVKFRNFLLYAESSNLIDLPHLNEPELIAHIKTRFERRHIFTFAGNVLLFVNPLKEIIPDPSYNVLLRNYLENMLDDTRSLEANKLISSNIIKHSIIISGESGSGKTETLKIILKSFADRQTSNAEQEQLFRKLFHCNKILESLGNARTKNTENSTRFGKLLELNFTGAGEIIGCNIRTYLLESSRTTSQQKEEGNFNIFYELLAGALNSEYIRWGVNPDDSFFYTNQGHIDITSKLFDQQKSYQEFKDSLKNLNFTEEFISELTDIFVCILYIGQIQLAARDDIGGGTYIPDRSNNSPLVNAARLLRVSPESLEKIMTEKTLFSARGEVLVSRFNLYQAITVRDAISKAIYKNVFDYLVIRVNDQLKTSFLNSSFSRSYSSDGDHRLLPSSLNRSIILLDIFGFDAFEFNSIDQLCINFANETLQQLFYYHLFKVESELYEREGIQFDPFVYSDNQENIDLISNGIFRILDDQCKLPDPTDKKFVAQIYRDFQTKKLFSASTVQKLDSKFSIQHFCGMVEYSADSFIVKNIDNVPADISSILEASSNSVISAMVHVAQDTSANLSPIKRKSLINTAPLALAGNSKAVAARNVYNSYVTRVKYDLSALITEVENTIPHYVRCIKPYANENNSEIDSSNNTPIMNSKHIHFDEFIVSEQLKSSGVIEALRITRTGFRTNFSYSEFFIRYRAMLAISNQYKLSSLTSFKIDPLNIIDQKTLKTKIIEFVGGLCKIPIPGHKNEECIDISGFQFGHTRIFLKKAANDNLDFIFSYYLNSFVTLIQRSVRKKLASSKYILMIYSIHLLLRTIRGGLARIAYRKLRLQRRIAITIQRQYRRRMFFRKLLTCQCFFRRCLAKKMYLTLKERRDKLLKLYGPLILARERRIKRRNNQTNNSSSFIRVIPPVETRVVQRNSLENSMIQEILTLFTPSKVGAESISGEIDLKKYYRALLSQIKILPKEAPCYKAVLAVSDATFLGEHLLKMRNLTKNYLLGRMVGSSFWKQISIGSIKPVDLIKSHPLFERIHVMIKNIEETKKLIVNNIQEYEDKRQEIRLNGVTSGNKTSDDLISELNTTLLCLRRLDSLFEIMKTYYDNFIDKFVKKYGKDSPFHKSFLNDEKKYLMSLISIVKSSKSFVPEKSEEKDVQNVYSVSVSPIKVDWKEVNEMQQMEKIKQSAIDENDFIKKMVTLELRKRDFNQENCRIIHTPNLLNMGFQFMPCQPGVGYSMNSLLFLSTGRLFNGVRIMKLAGTRQLAGKVAYYQVIRDLYPTSLLDVIYDPVQIEDIHPASFSASFIGCCVMNLTHLNPNQFLVKHDKQVNAMFGNLEERLIRMTYLNNDSILSNYFLDYNHPQRSTVNSSNLNVLFFFPQMDEPVDPDIIAFLTSSPFIAEEIVLTWLRDLHDQNKNFLALSSSGFTESDFKSLQLPITLPKGCATSIVKRIKDLSELFKRTLSSEKAVSHHDILQALYPLLSGYYQNIRLNSDFKEGLDFDGVVSYAYLYHQALDAEKGKVLSVRRKSVISTGQSGLTSPRSVDTRKSSMLRSSFYSKPATFNKISPNPREPSSEDLTLHSLDSFFAKIEDPDDSMNKENDPQLNDYEHDEHDHEESSRKESQNGENESKNEEDEASDIHDEDEILEQDEDFINHSHDDLHKTISGEAEDECGYDNIYAESGENHQAVIVGNENNLLSPRSSAIFASGSFSGRFGGSPNNKQPALVRQQTIRRRNDSDGDQTTPYVPYESVYNLNIDDRMDDSMFFESPLAAKKITKTSNRVVRSSIGFKQIPTKEDKDQANVGDLSNLYGKDDNENFTSRNEFTSDSLPTNFREKLRRGSMQNIKSDAQMISPVVSPVNTGRESFASPRSIGSTGQIAPEPLNSNRSDLVYDSAREVVETIDPATLALSRHTPYTRTVDEECFSFLNSLDWRIYSNIQPVERAQEFCVLVGKNLCFLPMIWLNFIEEWQLYFYFKYWLDLLEAKQLKTAAVRLVTREIILRYNTMQELEAIKDSNLLISLQLNLQIDIKFAILSDESLARRKESQTINVLGDNKEDEFDIYDYTAPQEEPPTNLREIEIDLNRKQEMMTQLSPGMNSPGAGLASFSVGMSMSIDFNDKTPDLDEEDPEWEKNIPPKFLELRNRLMKVLWSCMSVMEAHDPENVGRQVTLIKKIIRRITCGKSEAKIEISSILEFIPLLLEFPGLSSIGLVMAKKRIFVNQLSIIVRLVTHGLVDRYVDLIIALVRNHPELASYYDRSSNMYICDLIKKISETKPCKYVLLTAFINNVYDYQERMMKASSLTGSFYERMKNPAEILRWKAIFSQYRSEEELIIAASFFFFPATENELKLRKYNTDKRDNRGESLLMRLIRDDYAASLNASPISPIRTPTRGSSVSFILPQETSISFESPSKFSLADEPIFSIQNEIWQTYELFIQTLRERVMSGKMNLKDFESILRYTMDEEIEKVSKADSNISKSNLQKSRIVQDIQVQLSIKRTSSIMSPGLVVANISPKQKTAVL